MILGPTIEHLRAYCPVFATRVAGAAEFTKGLRDYNENMALPAAYVVASTQESESGNENQIGYWQIVRKSIEVVVELDATSDRRGQAPAMQFDDIERALFAALLNWTPVECRVPNMQGYQFGGGRVLDLDRARLFYAWEFVLPYQLTEEDGWQDPVEPVDLTEIDLLTYHKPGAAPIDELNDVPAAEVHIITDPPTPIPGSDEP